MPYFSRRRSHEAQTKQQPLRALQLQQQQQQQRQDEPSADRSQTPETQGSCEEIMPSFEVQPTSNETLDVWIQNTAESNFSPRKPTTTSYRSQQQLAPGVASAWLQMGAAPAQSKPHSQPQPPQATSIFRRGTTTTSGQQQQQRLVDWWGAPCAKPVPEPPTVRVFWSRRSRNTREETRPKKSGSEVRAMGCDADRFSTTFPRGFRTSVAQSPSHRTNNHAGATAVRLSQRWSFNPKQQRHHQPAQERPSNNNNNPVSLRPRVSLFDSPSDNHHHHSDRRRDQERNEASAWRIHRRPNNSRRMTDAASKWKTAVDPKSGKTYYYHTETRETQWRKPMELATTEEKEAMAAKEQRQRDFFSAMEANILKNLQTGTAFSSPVASEHNKKTPGMSKIESNLLASDDEDDGANSDCDSSDDEAQPKRRGDLAAAERPNLVRTISSMDEHILKDLVMRVPSHRTMSTGEIPGFPPSKESPTDVGTNGTPNAIERGVSDGTIEEMELLSIEGEEEDGKGSRPRRPNALKNSTSMRQPSLGTMLATLPEEHDNDGSLNHMEFSFGEESMYDMGLSEQESQALISFAQASSEMALMGDESFANLDGSLGNMGGLEGSLGNLAFEEEDEDYSEEPSQEESESESNHGLIPEEDPFANMDMQPTPPVGHARKGRRKSAKIVPSKPHAKPKISRRNTCGTLYVGSTMSAPDIDATIKCVCGVIRAHILQSEVDADFDEFVMFNDQESQQRRGSMRMNKVVPTLDDVCAFYRDVFRKAQMESDCIIMSLIYVERLVKVTHGKLRPRARNWRSVVFSCMVLASKVWDDLSMWNGDFSQTCPAGVNFTLQRINELELAVLEALGYKVKVPASEYAKYYFLLRAMLIKSGLGGESMKEMNPLDVEGARRLQAVSSKYQRAASLRMVGNQAGGRSKSLTIEIEGGEESRKLAGGASRNLIRVDSPKGKMSLEHMVQM